MNTGAARLPPPMHVPACRTRFMMSVQPAALHQGATVPGHSSKGQASKLMRRHSTATRICFLSVFSLPVKIIAFLHQLRLPVCPGTEKFVEYEGRRAKRRIPDKFAAVMLPLSIKYAGRKSQISRSQSFFFLYRRQIADVPASMSLVPQRSRLRTRRR